MSPASFGHWSVPLGRALYRPPKGEGTLVERELLVIDERAACVALR